MQNPWLKSYPAGIREEIDVDEFSSVADIFDTSVAKFRDRPAYTNFGKTLSYQEVDVYTAQLASYLKNELGLAKGTVSRALNGYPDISESTRQRVKHAAEVMGYSPLSHAQAIRTGVVRSIGLVLQTSEHDGHRPFLASFLAGISEAAS